VIIRGVEMDGVQLAQLGTAAGPEYSHRARAVGKLCPSCDLGLPMSCECPPCSAWPLLRMITFGGTEDLL
jgi:hypothetical protein